ncbi:chymotrypsinogen 2-like protein, partial [Leptotrombidium deliense]
ESSTANNSSPTVLLHATVPEYNWKDCNEYYANGLHNTQFCAGIENEGSCGGDQGAALFKRVSGKYYIVGVVAFGPGNCVTSNQDVWTKVTSHLDWIKSNTKDAVYCQS